MKKAIRRFCKVKGHYREHTRADGQEQLEQLEQPDAIFEAELKQALKESKREAHGANG